MYNDYNNKEVARASRIGLRLSGLRSKESRKKALELAISLFFAVVRQREILMTSKVLRTPANSGVCLGFDGLNESSQKIVCINYEIFWTVIFQTH